MITTTLSAFNLCKSQVIALGRQLENNYRQIVFDCSDFSEEITAITLVHQRKDDVAPYIVATSTGDTLTWTITDTDTAYYGYGKGELRITFDSGLAKSIVFTTMVIKSITADTTIPQPLQSWYDAMIDYIDENSISPEELGQAIEDYLEEHPIQVPVQSVNGETGAVVITAADLGALTVELDPVFGASAAAGITSADITAWNGKYTKPTGGVPVSDLNSTAQSRLMPTGGTTGQVLAKKTNSNYDLEWVNQSGGGGAVDSVNGKTGTVVLDADDVGALPDTTTASDLGAYVKPTNGIPKTDLASAVQTSLGKADTALQSAPVTSVNGQTGAVVIPTATTSANGLMSSADKALLDSVTERIASTLPVNTVTGAIVSVTDGADNIPVKDLTIAITPAQSGSGDPSPTNVRPISGWTGANVHVNDDVIAIDWQSTAGTVYGGSLDVTTGVLTVDRAMVDLGTLTWTYSASYNIFSTNIYGKKPGHTEGAVSQYSNGGWWSGWTDKDGVWCGNPSNDGFVVKDTRFTDAATFKTAMNGVQFCYELATPQTYQLTPTEVSTLLGSNNVWADTGDTTLTYRASLQPVYDDYSSALVALNGGGN